MICGSALSARAHLAAGWQRAEPGAAAKPSSWSYLRTIQPTLAVSPDGQLVAFTARREWPSDDELRRRSRGLFLDTGFHRQAVNGVIRVKDLTSGAESTVSDETASSFQPVWSPSSQQLAFFSDAGGVTRVWLWQRKSQTAHTAADRPVQPLDTRSLFWTNDGSALYVRLGASSLAATEDRAPSLPSNRPSSPVTVLIHKPRDKGASVAGPSLTAANPGWTGSLGLLNVRERAIAPIVQDVGIRSFWPSPDGTHVAFLSGLGNETGDNGRWHYDLSVARVSDGVVTRLASDIRMTIFGATVSWSPDSRFVAYTTGEGLHSALDRKADGQCYMVSVHTGTRRRVAERSAAYFGDRYRPPLWTADGRALVLIADGQVWLAAAHSERVRRVTMPDGWTALDIVRHRSAYTPWQPRRSTMFVMGRHETTLRNGLVEVDFATGISKVLWESNVSMSFDFANLLDADVAAAAGRIVALAESPDYAEGVAQLDLRADGALWQAPTTVSGEGQRRSVIQWVSEDGLERRGLVVLPPGAGAPPTVATFYPGTRCSLDRNRYFINTIDPNRFIDKGLGLFCIDVPLTGAGMRQDTLAAVLPGVTELVKSGMADGARLGLLGRSVGAYGVSLVLPATDRFSAAVMISGFSDPTNWFLLQGNASAGLLRDKSRFGSAPWENPGEYMRSSLLYQLDKVQTPLLLVHGTQDTAVPSWLSEQVFAGLAYLDKEVSLVRYVDEAHGILQNERAEDMWQRTLSWFQEHLRSAIPNDSVR